MLEYLHQISKEYDSYEMLLEFFLYLISVDSLCENFELGKVSISMICKWVHFGRKINRKKLCSIIKNYQNFKCTYDPELSSSCKIYYPLEKKLKGKKLVDSAVTFTIKTTGKICISGPSTEKNKQVYDEFCEIVRKYQSSIFY